MGKVLIIKGANFSMNAIKQIQFETGSVEPPEYVTIVTDVTPTGGGTVRGGGEYIKDTNVTLVAVPSDGYKFVKWNNGSTRPSITVSASDATYIAEFAIIEYEDNSFIWGRGGLTNFIGTCSGSTNAAMSTAVPYTGDGKAKDVYEAITDVKLRIGNGYTLSSYILDGHKYYSNDVANHEEITFSAGSQFVIQISKSDGQNANVSDGASAVKVLGDYRKIAWSGNATVDNPN